MSGSSRSQDTTVALDGFGQLDPPHPPSPFVRPQEYLFNSDVGAFLSPW